MKNITFMSFIAIFLVSCGNGQGNDQKSEYISACIAQTPGGSSYQELCVCAYDTGVALMTPEEKTAWEREFSEVVDAQYIFTAPMKFVVSFQECLDEALH